MTTKVCRKCQVEKPETEFYARNKSKGHLGLKYMCKSCENLAAKDRYHAKYKHDEQRPKTHYLNKIKAKYKLTEEEYFKLWEETKGKCFICGSVLFSAFDKQDDAVRSVVDHCHETGKVRGIICHKCNGGLGQFNDDLSTLKRAVDYLERHNK